MVPLNVYLGVDHLTDEPIAAWEIQHWELPAEPGVRKWPTLRRHIMPVCVDNEVNDCNYPDAIRDPRGRYHCSAGSKFNTAEETFAHLKTAADRSRLNFCEDEKSVVRMPSQIACEDDGAMLREIRLRKWRAKTDFPLSHRFRNFAKDYNL